MIATRPRAISRAGAFMARALRIEFRIYTSIGRLVARRPAIEAGGTGFSYHRPVRATVIAFIVLAAVEIPLVDLLVHDWPSVRIPFLVLGIWGLTWMTGLLVAFHTRLHTVGPTGIAVRDGLEIDLPIPWSQIASVARLRNVDGGDFPRVTATERGNMLSLRVEGVTNIEIALEGEVPVRLPGHPPKGGTHAVTRMRIWVDDPAAFLAAVVQHTPLTPPPANARK